MSVYEFHTVHDTFVNVDDTLYTCHDDFPLGTKRQGLEDFYCFLRPSSIPNYNS